MRRVLICLLLLGLASGPATAAIDPFYRNRMDGGVRAFERGDWESAARQLRIACFGHLDEPPLLAAGLVRLAVVEARRGDEDAFRRIFSRLVDLEERFSAYSGANLPAALRQQFQGVAAQLVPAEILRMASGFTSVARQAEIDRIGKLPPGQRRAELEARIEAERPQAALDWLDRLPAELAGLPPASCLRQQAGTEAGDCDRMDLVQPFCQDVPANVVEFRLQCLVEAARWSEAAGLIGGLSPELRARRRVVRLERRARKNFDGDFSTPAVAAVGSETVAAASSPAPPADAVPTPTPPAEPAPTPQETASEEVDRLRQRLDSATTADELAELRRAAESLADGAFGSRQTHLLAAEIAYLQSDWTAAVGHFGRVGRLDASEASLAFYQAVALYETGDPAAAARVLRPVAGQLQRNEFVDAYVERILAPGG
jgi:hypothetical protein